jgi:uncharacterized protein (DUF2267 family)
MRRTIARGAGVRTTKRLVRFTGIAADVVGVVAAAAPDTRLGRSARKLADRLARDVRYAVASAPGILYRLAGRRPDPDVSDDVLADRVRSALGPLEKRLDVPRVHVMVEDHVVIVHGEVPTQHTAHRIEHTIGCVSGVRGVESHLHAGMAPGDTRPSEGRAAASPPSEALRTLLDAARAAGAGGEPRAAVHAVLCALFDRIPPGEREQVAAHLPADVRALAGPPRRAGLARRLRTIPELVAAATAEGGLDRTHAEEITRAVVAALRTIVPHEAADVAAVLPAGLRELWVGEPAR